MAALELAERPLGLDAGRVRVALVVELARLAVLVGPDRRAVEHRTRLLVRLRAWRRRTTAPTRPRGSSSGSSSCARRRSHPASEKAVEQQRSQGKLLAHERLEKLLDPGSFVELDRFVRHRESLLRDDGAAALRRRRRHRLRDDLRPQGLRLLAGLHDLRRQPLRGVRREDLQGHGPGREVRLPA